MASSADEIQKRLDQLVFIGIGVSCLSAVLTFMVIPPMPMNPGINTVVKIYMLIPVLLGIFVLWQIHRHKNWARRLMLAVFFSWLPSILMTFVPSAHAAFGPHRFMGRISGVINLLYSAVFTVFLFKSEVRSLFIATPAKRSRQVLYAELAFCIGLSYVILGHISQRYATHLTHLVPPGKLSVPKMQ